jgi:quinol monooxygenase YgiN
MATSIFSAQDILFAPAYNAFVTSELPSRRRRSAAGQLFTSNHAKGVLTMFTRIVECYVKNDKRQDFKDTLQQHVLPILRSQPGFVDLLALSSDDEPDRTVSISIWKSRADAERYHRDHFQEVTDALRPLLRDEPSVELYNVETSTAHRITMGKAA